jgi:hypothetical protein
MQPSDSGYRSAVPPHPYGLDEEEHAALIALITNQARPPVNDPIWTAAEFAGLVTVDRDVNPPTLTLTRTGARYGDP